MHPLHSKITVHGNIKYPIYYNIFKYYTTYSNSIAFNPAMDSHLQTYYIFYMQHALQLQHAQMKYHFKLANAVRYEKIY